MGYLNEQAIRNAQAQRELDELLEELQRHAEQEQAAPGGGEVQSPGGFGGGGSGSGEGYGGP